MDLGMKAYPSGQRPLSLAKLTIDLPAVEKRESFRTCTSLRKIDLCKSVDHCSLPSAG